MSVHMLHINNALGCTSLTYEKNRTLELFCTIGGIYAYRKN